MTGLGEKISLVIPCYNEASRLNMDEFSYFDENCYFIFVNDGSTDETADLLQSSKKENFYILDLERNAGKGEAIRQGMLYLRKLPIYDEVTWVGYWDSDLATSLSEVYNFINYHKLFYPDVDAIWGSRISRRGSNILRSYQRKIFSRLFSLASNFLFHHGCYDSQCGAKLFKKEVIEKAFSQPFISRWIFDIEIILRLNNNLIAEYGLNSWQDVSGSKIRFFRVFFNTFLDLIKIKHLYVDGSWADKSEMDKNLY